MEGINLSNDIQPFIENITIDSSFLDDQGDIFHCGKCNLNFNSFIEFVSHKKEHSLPQSSEPVSTQIVVQNDFNVLTLGEQSNQVWVWNQNNSADNNEIIVTPIDESPVNDKIHAIQYETVVNFTENQNNIEKLSESNNREIRDINIDCGKDDEKPRKSLLTCSICQREFKKQFNFFLHFKLHSGEKQFQCIICGRTFPQNSNKKKHMLSHRVWPEGLGNTLPEKSIGSDLGYKCMFCNIILQDYKTFKNHLKEHDQQKVYKCIQRKCSAMYADLDSLIAHVKTEHSTVEYFCQLCPLIFNSLEDISNHYQEHVLSKTTQKSKGKYTCVYCRCSFKKHSHLLYHLDTANHVNNCVQCGKTFTTEKSLRRHLSLHDTNKIFKCDICNASFINKNYLRTHLATHMEEKSFICSICNYKFARKDLLMRHMKIHQPNKKKKCPFRAHSGCMMEFTRTDKLNLHIKTHIKSFNTKKKTANIKTNKKESGQSSTMEIIIVPLSETESLNNSKDKIVEISDS